MEINNEGKTKVPDRSVIIRIGNQYSISSFELLSLSAWAHVGLLFFVGVVLYLVTGETTLSQVITTTYYVLLIMLSFREICKAIKFKDFVFLLFVIAILSYSFFIYPEGRETVIEKIPELFFQVLSFYFVGLFMKTDEEYTDKAYLISEIAVLVNWVYIFVFNASGRVMVEDNMTMGYQVLPYALFCLWYALQKPSKRHTVMAILGVVFVISMGTRAPLLSIVLFAVVYLLFGSYNHQKTVRLLTIGIGTILFLFILSGLYENILAGIGVMLRSVGLSSRIVDSIIYNAAESSGLARDRIRLTITNAIQMRPYTGYGIYGEEAMLGYKSHSIIYGMWFHYGMIAGTVFLALLALKFLKTIKVTYDPIARGLFFVVLANGLVRCFFSGTYLCAPLFMALGLAVNLTRQNKYKRN